MSSTSHIWFHEPRPTDKLKAKAFNLVAITSKSYFNYIRTWAKRAVTLAILTTRQPLLCLIITWRVKYFVYYANECQKHLAGFMRATTNMTDNKIFSCVNVMFPEAPLSTEHLQNELKTLQQSHCVVYSWADHLPLDHSASWKCVSITYKQKINIRR